MSYTAQQAAAILVRQSKSRSGAVMTTDLQQPAKQSRFTISIPLKGENVLAFNSNSQAFAVWSRDDLQTWKRLEEDDIPIGTTQLRSFLDGGFIVPANTDEIANVRNDYEAFRYDPGNMLLTITPTLACNFGCSYCFQGLDKPITRMREDVKEALLNYVEAKLPSLNDLFVTWYGGEPLMDKQTIFELSPRLIELCEAHGVTYSGFIVTNGYFLDATVAKKLVECRVTAAQVTIDGAAEHHDARRHLTSGKPTYSRVLSNVAAAVEQTDINVVIRVNIDSTNASGVYSLLDDLAERGLGKHPNCSVYFAPVEAITDDCKDCSDDTMAKLSYGELEAELTERAMALGLAAAPRPGKFHGACQAVRPNGVVVIPNGDLHKCWDTVMNRKMRVGSVFDETPISEHSVHKKWMRWSPFDSDVCVSCKLLPSCAGACAFKFVHPEQTSGEAGALPCPSWKFNLAERLFVRAKRAGIVSNEDWCSETSPTVEGASLKTGQRHSAESVAKAAATLDMALAAAE